MATSSGSHRFLKGILKNKGCTSSSVAAPAQQHGGPKQLQTRTSKKLDKSNILATCGSVYKDYDAMKTNEPNTPHVRIQDTLLDLETKLQIRDNTGDNSQRVEPESKGAETSKVSWEKQEKQRQFELRRKLHQDEARNIKLARELIAEEFGCEEIDDEHKESPPITKEDKTEAGEPDNDSANDELQTLA